MIDDEGFQFVNVKKAAKRKRGFQYGKGTHGLSNLSIHDVSVDELLEKVSSSCSTLGEGSYLPGVLSSLRDACSLNASTRSDVSLSHQAAGVVFPQVKPKPKCQINPQLSDTTQTSECKKNGGGNGEVNTGDIPPGDPSEVDRISLQRELVGCAHLQEIVCYGVGNFSGSAIARYQLALLLRMREELGIPLEKTYMFDPMFSAVEKQSLSQLGLTVLAENEQGKRRACQPTLFYMPHCGKALYNNLLWRNWDPSALGNVVVMGNSFSRMLLSTPERILRREAGYVARISDVTHEVPIANIFAHSDVFNDTSIHVFKRQALYSCQRELWDNSREPTYEDSVADIL